MAEHLGRRDPSNCQMGSGVFARRKAGPAPSGLRPLGEIWSPPQEVDDLPPDLAVVFEVHVPAQLPSLLASCACLVDYLFSASASPRDAAL